MKSIAFLVLAVPVFAQTPVVPAVPVPGANSMTPTDIALIVGCIGSILAFLGTVANMFFTNYKEARNRRWAIEDAERQWEKTDKCIRHVGSNVQNTVVLKAEEAKEARDRLAVQVDEGTKASHAAFKEANSVNEKIASLGGTIAAAQPQKVIVANQEPIPVKETAP